MQNFTLFHPIESRRLLIWYSTHICLSNALYFISVAICGRYITIFTGLPIKWTFTISVDMRQLTPQDNDCIALSALCVCLLFVCLLVYLFICLFIYIKAVNSSPEGIKVLEIHEKITFPTFPVNLNSLSLKMAEILMILDFAILLTEWYRTERRIR